MALQYKIELVGSGLIEPINAPQFFSTAERYEALRGRQAVITTMNPIPSSMSKVAGSPDVQISGRILARLSCEDDHLVMIELDRSVDSFETCVHLQGVVDTARTHAFRMDASRDLLLLAQISYTFVLIGDTSYRSMLIVLADLITGLSFIYIPEYFQAQT